MTVTLPNDVQKLFSQRSNRAGQQKFSNPKAAGERISFRSGYPDPKSMPKSDMAEATRVALERDGEWALQYGANRGYDRLLEELRKKLKRDQGIDCEEENLLIVSGAGQGLALIVDTFCDPGDVVISEEPTWMGAVKHFRNAGVDVETVRVDDQGTDVAALEESITRLIKEGRHPKFIYMIPNFQNPIGVTTTVERRKAIIELAGKYTVPIIEDDAYSDLRYEGDRVETMYQLDHTGMVLYLSTFSKIIGAGLRLGWIIAHPQFIGAIGALKPEGGTSPFVGAAAAEFCGSGTLVEHIGELRAVYDGRRRAMLAALESEMPNGVSWTIPEGGFFVWVTLPEQVRVTELSPKLEEQGVEVSPGPVFYFGEGGEHELRLSYSFADESQIETGVRILASEIRQALSQ